MESSYHLRNVQPAKRVDRPHHLPHEQPGPHHPPNRQPIKQPDRLQPPAALPVPARIAPVPVQQTVQTPAFHGSTPRPPTEKQIQNTDHATRVARRVQASKRQILPTPLYPAVSKNLRPRKVLNQETGRGQQKAGGGAKAPSDVRMDGAGGNSGRKVSSDVRMGEISEIQVSYSQFSIFIYDLTVAVNVEELPSRFRHPSWLETAIYHGV